jgi:hypothetical protein
MKKLSFMVVLVMVVALAVPCLAQRVVIEPPPPPRIVIEAPVPPPPPRVRVVVPLPPPIVFAQPPEMVVLPETEVYVVPEYEQDLFFYNGWWFRLWEGRWYRSREYGSGWGYYQGIPSWYGGVYPGWRENYRTHMWGGHPWEHHHIPHHEFRNNWRGWHERGHWKNHNNWGTKGTHGTLHKGTGTLHKGTGTKQFSGTGTHSTTKQFHSGTSTKQFSGTKSGTKTGTINKSPGATKHGTVERK